MYMKKLIITLTVACICMSAFAQNDKAKAFFAKAKELESQKKYASAMGNYYDAIIADEENCDEALEAFQRIQNQILSGQPGFDNYNEFSLYDNWRLLLRDAEVYWTTNRSNTFSFCNLSKENVNYDKRTADYTVHIETRCSEKYETIVLDTIRKGIEKAYVESWGKIKEWPAVSVFTPKDGTAAQIYQKYGAAIVKYPSTNGKRIDLASKMLLAYLSSNDPKWNTYSEDEKANALVYGRLYTDLGSKSIYYDSSETYYAPAFASTPTYTVNPDIYQGDTYKFEKRKDFGFLDIKFALADEYGKPFLESARIAAPSISASDSDANKYTFKNVSEKLMKKIDEGDYHIILTAIFLNYGDYDPNLEDLYTRKSINNLPDIKIKTESIGNNKSVTEIIKIKAEQEKIEQEKILAEETEKKNKIFEEINFYCTGYENRKGSAPYNMMITMKKIGVELDQLDNYKVINVIKKSPAQKSKIDTNCVLIAINNIPINELQNKAHSLFQEIEQLEAEANLYHQDDYHDIEKLAEISNTLIEKIIDLRDGFIISVDGNYYIDKMPSGTTLQFEKNAKGKTTQIEITVPW